MIRAATRRAERALRALEKSGRRLVERGDGWVVMASADLRRRPFARLSDAEARDLIAGGSVAPCEGGGFVLAVERDMPEPPTRDLSAYAGAGRKPRAAGFAGLARLAERGEGPLSMRGAAAGLRLARDAEASERRRGLSMDWDLIPTDRRPRGATQGGLGSAAREATNRIAKLKRTIGDEAFRLAWFACVEGLTLSAVAQRCAISRNTCGERLGEALEDLADAYERA